MSLDVTLLRGRRELAAMEDEWRALAERAAFPTVFDMPEWGLAWLEAFPRTGLKAFAARRDGELVGFLPLAEVRGEAVDFYCLRMEPLGGRFADYHVPLVDKGSPEALTALLKALGNAHGRHILLWQQFPASDPALSWLKAVLDEHGWPWTSVQAVCPVLHMKRSYEETAEAWAAKLRRDIRRRRKKEEAGDLRLEVLNNIDEIHGWLDEFFEVYNSKWLGQGKPSDFTSQRMRRFYHAMAARMHGSILHVSSLIHAGKRISYHFGFITHGRFYYYKTAYRPEFATLSPTKLHVSLLVEQGCAEGWSVFDFGQGDEEYKFQWTKDIEPCELLVVGVNGHGVRYEWYACLREKARQKFGSSVRKIRHALQTKT